MNKNTCLLFFLKLSISFFVHKFVIYFFTACWEMHKFFDHESKGSVAHSIVSLDHLCLIITLTEFKFKAPRQTFQKWAFFIFKGCKFPRQTKQPRIHVHRKGESVILSPPCFTQSAGEVIFKGFCPLEEAKIQESAFPEPN